MKATHLLIPIRDIEDRIKEMNSYDLSINSDKIDRFEFIKEFEVLEKLLASSKQISLNEDDINKDKAGKYAHDSEDYWKDSHRKTIAFNSYLQGYKQALKDLL